MEDWSKVLVFGARSEGEQWVIRPSAGNVMAKLIVRNLESKLVEELRLRAAGRPKPR